MAPNSATASQQSPTNLLSLPLEIRLQIYAYALAGSNIHSFRPQRKIGWNRPHADLSNPNLLFESDSHPVLRQLFHGKITKNDHNAILMSLLHYARVLVVTFEDFAAVQKVANATVLPSVAVGLSAQARSFAGVVKDNLRVLDFNDKLDEIVCQPSDLVKLMTGLPGLRTVCLTSKHVQRYSGTVEEHVEFAKERAEREMERFKAQQANSSSYLHDSFGVDKRRNNSSINDTVDEFRRLHLRSPMTDGSRMTISPALFSGYSTPRSLTSTSSSRSTWVVVDLSLLVWQHFLYTGAPYRDHWRCVKMQTLLQAAEKQHVDVVMNFRNVEFDPSLSPRRTSLLTPRTLKIAGLFRGEMSTADWMLRLRHRTCGLEYSVRQRRQFDVPVSQEQSGMTRCRHRRRRSSVCEDCDDDGLVKGTSRDSDDVFST